MNFEPFGAGERKNACQHVGLHGQVVAGEVGVPAVVDFRKDGVDIAGSHGGEKPFPLVERSIGMERDPNPVLAGL
jgi:hypothetical protein